MLENKLNLDDFIIKTKSQILEWIEDFEKLRKSILTSDDARKDNYSFKRLNLEEQEEITVVYFQKEIVAFSSLYPRDYYPLNVSRVLNRTWKSPKVRYFPQIYQPAVKRMLFVQLQKASELNKSAVFISVERSDKWLKNFTLQLQREDKRWLHCKGLHKVAPGEASSCWQYISYLPFKSNYKLQFPKLSLKEYNLLFRSMADTK